MCVVVLPIGLPRLVMLGVSHSGDRDTRWVFCYSRGWGVGMLKMADVSAEAELPPDAEADASALQTGQRASPLPRRGRGAGDEGEKACAPRTQ